MTAETDAAGMATHCIHGHEYTPENTGYRKDRSCRVCRTCNITQKRAARLEAWKSRDPFERRNLTLIDRFWQKVMPEPMSGCWLWIGRVDTCGYARIAVKGKNSSAHRWAYQEFVGPIPSGAELDHKCQVRCCVNPQHLQPVTHAENLRLIHRRRRAA